MLSFTNNIPNMAASFSGFCDFYPDITASVRKV